MTKISRRDVVVSAGAAAAVLSLGRPLAFINPARGQESTAPKGFHRFKLGEAEVTTVYDGIWEKPHTPEFIRNASVEETKAALRAAGLPEAHVPITFTVTFVKIGGRTIMFDSGTGGQLAPTAGKLAGNMQAAGIDPGAIDLILVTHFHPDHIFGLMAKDTNEQVYPKAQIVVPAAEYGWWTDPVVTAQLPKDRQGLAKRIQATFPTWTNLTQVEGEKEVAPGIRAVPSPGHTAGHTVYLVGSGSDQLVNLADTSTIPALFVRNPGWHAAFDADPVQAEANRRKWFDRVVADRIAVVGYHFGMPGAGRIEKDGGSYAFVPMS